MTSYTQNWGLPKPDPSDRIAASTQNLRMDLGALADKTDQVFTQTNAALKEATTLASRNRQDVDRIDQTMLPKTEAAQYGIEGPEGPSPELVSGTTEQVPAGQQAKVELIKTGEAQYRMDARIPRGIDGDPTAVSNLSQAMAAEVNTTGTPANTAVSAQIQQRAVTGVGVTRIVASVDPLYPIEPGELLVVLKDPRPQFFVDFSTHPVGAGVPEGWSEPWATSAFWEVVTEPGIGNILRNTSTELGHRRFLSLDAAANAAAQYADQEIVVKWRGSGDPRGVFRAAGSLGAETGYWVGRNIQNVSVGRYKDGTSGSFAHHMSSPANNRWYITRARVEGDRIQARTWLADQLEPTTWATDVTNTDISEPGLVGLLDPLNRPAEFAYFGVGFDGARAPQGPLV